MSEVHRLEGTKHIYTLRPSESSKVLGNGEILVAHPDLAPFIIKADGNRIDLTPCDRQDVYFYDMDVRGTQGFCCGEFKPFTGG